MVNIHVFGLVWGDKVGLLQEREYRLKAFEDIEAQWSLKSDPVQVVLLH